MPADGSIGPREQPGVKKSLRMWRNGEAYGYVDPDELASLDEPPDHCVAAMEDVLGPWASDEEGRPRLKMRVHPHMRRWALYEREYRPEVGEELWRCFYIFQTDPVKGVLPSDMRGDLYKAHFAGRVGEYIEPDRSHFEMLEKFNIAKYGVNAVNEHAGQLEDKAEKEKEEAMREKEAAFIDENWHLCADEANQKAGSGTHMRSSWTDTFKYQTNLSRWHREEKNGYTIVTKKSREEYERELKEEVSRFALAWGAVRGLRRHFTPTDAEWDEIFEKSGWYSLPEGHIFKLSSPGSTSEARRAFVEKQLQRDLEEHLINRAPSEEERTERLQMLRSIQRMGQNT